MAGENTVKVNADNFESEVLKSNVPVLVDFWAEWCRPCLQIGPVLEELAAEYQGRVKIAKVDIADEKNQMIAAQYNVNGIPALFMIKNGNVVAQLLGAKPKSEFKKVIDGAIA